MLLNLGAIGVSSGVFGDDRDSSVLFGVDCSGNETEILSCSSSDYGDVAYHSASVICQGQLVEKRNN